MFGDIFVKQHKQRGSERVPARKSSVLVKSAHDSGGAGGGPAGTPKKGSAATVVVQGAGRSLAQVRTETMAVLAPGLFGHARHSAAAQHAQHAGGTDAAAAAAARPMHPDDLAPGHDCTRNRDDSDSRARYGLKITPSTWDALQVREG
jgi:hypothetical protein